MLALFTRKEKEFLAASSGSMDEQWASWIDIDPHFRSESDDLGMVVLRRTLYPHEGSWPGRLDGLLVARSAGAAAEYVRMGLFSCIPDIVDGSVSFPTIRLL